MYSSVSSVPSRRTEPGSQEPFNDRLTAEHPVYSFGWEMMRGRPLQLVFVLVVLLIFSIARKSAASERPKNGINRPARLKSVELEGKYIIQVPDYFILRRMDGAATAVPMYSFDAPKPHYTTIRVSVLPRAGIIPIDQKTGRFQLPFECDGGLPPLTDYFEISGKRDVYYGWSVVDNAYECSMNSPCPLPWPPKSKSRYTTQYAFAVLDENSCLEFTGMHSGPSKKVTGFEGDGKLLRDIIVPSLRSLH